MPAGATDPGYIITVKIGASDTQEATLQKYGGAILSWYPDPGIAHLKLSTAEHAALMSRGVSVQSTANGTLSAPTTQANGFKSWVGGFNSWAGGFNSWAGGWNSWDGGTNLPSMPDENNAVFMQIRLPQAHAIARKFGEGVKVAVVDTGVDTAHPGFVGRLAPSSEWRDFIENDNNPMEPTGGSAYGHGTAVAGLILQVAPKATILPIRVLNSNGQGDLDDVILAINHAVNVGVKIINLSLGAFEWYQPLVDAINFAGSRGVWVVTSAGNQGKKNEITYPGRWGWWLSNVIGVGSVDSDDKLSKFSSFGADVFTWAPGNDVSSYYPGNRTAKFRGTSFAAPLVAGALALAYSETTAIWIRNDLKYYYETSLELRSLWYNLYRANSSWCSVPDGQGGLWCHGAGRLDVERFLRSLPGFSPASNTGTLDFVRNGSFESGSFANWTTSGPVSIGRDSRFGDFIAGANSARISGTGSLEQTITGLAPNTTYTLTAWLKVDGSGESLLLGARNFGRSEVGVPAVGSTDWVQRSVDFKTGANNTSAVVFIRKTAGWQAAFADLITVTRK
ncbi:S8 family serine peptidase [Meiothermus sp.]|uniref:S8 family peptidase n=1 Tax=Meiothermus sp. TaxID=1955249 RepID=UPI0026388CE4|nr:S8 family serine peptidase [Meiothermus sp.]